jgi:hypothetical protein
MTTAQGILGVYRSNPKVIGVYPELSATLIPNMQEIRLRRGDSLNIAVQIQDDHDPPDPVSIDAEAVLRWAAKIGYGKTEREGVVIGNEGALILKRTYSTDEIELTGAGRAIVHLRRADTLRLPLSPAVWDLEMTKPTEAIAVPTGGQVQFVAGTHIAIASGLDWTALNLRPGDLFTAHGRTVLITGILSPAHLELDYTGWPSGSIPSSEVKLAVSETRTVASGPFIVEGDVVI